MRRSSSSIYSRPLGIDTMGLREDAEKLLETLTSIAAGLGEYQGSPVQMKYTHHLRHRLGPLIEELRALIDGRFDRSEILRAMVEIKAMMYEVSGAHP